jgi:hypothetical protein
MNNLYEKIEIHKDKENLPKEMGHYLVWGWLTTSDPDWDRETTRDLRYYERFFDPNNVGYEEGWLNDVMWYFNPINNLKL